MCIFPPPPRIVSQHGSIYALLWHLLHFVNALRHSEGIYCKEFTPWGLKIRQWNTFLGLQQPWNEFNQMSKVSGKVTLRLCKNRQTLLEFTFSP